MGENPDWLEGEDEELVKYVKELWEGKKISDEISEMIKCSAKSDMTSEQSEDLYEAYCRVENKRDWITCPHCNSANVKIKYFSQWSDMRPQVDCQNCPANGFFD